MERPHKHHLLNQDEIAHLAHEMYLIEGKPEGREVDHWLAAERELATRALSTGAKKKQAAPKPKTATPVIAAKKPRAVARKA